MIELLDLGLQPIANDFTEPEDNSQRLFFSLRMGIDPRTKLVSLMEVIDSKKIYTDEYVYRSSGSATMRKHFADIAEKIKQDYNPGRVLEIGSNDGAFLKNFNPDMADSVEPCGNFAQETADMGYLTYPEFWTYELAKEMGPVYDVVYSANCICHIPDLRETFDAVGKCLTDDGIFIFEDPTITSVLQKNSYDQVYVEHVHLFSIIALDSLLRSSGMRIIDVEDLPVHGGSNRIYAVKWDSPQEGNKIRYFAARDKEVNLGMENLETYYQFAERVESSKLDLVDLLTKLKAEGERVISYGATAKSTTVFNYCNIGPELIDSIMDNTLAKQGKLAPGSKIPVVSDEEGIPDDVNYVFLGAWNFQEEICEKEAAYLERGGKFITHVPAVHLITKNE